MTRALSEASSSRTPAPQLVGIAPYAAWRYRALSDCISTIKLTVTRVSPDSSYKQDACTAGKLVRATPAGQVHNCRAPPPVRTAIAFAYFALGCPRRYGLSSGPLTQQGNHHDDPHVQSPVLPRSRKITCVQSFCWPSSPPWATSPERSYTNRCGLPTTRWRSCAGPGGRSQLARRFPGSCDTGNVAARRRFALVRRRVDGEPPRVRRGKGNLDCVHLHGLVLHERLQGWLLRREPSYGFHQPAARQGAGAPGAAGARDDRDSVQGPADL